MEFLGLAADTGPQLSPAELAGRYRHVLTTAIRLTRQMPDARLSNMLPNRPRTWRVLMHHLFQIPNAFLDMDESGTPMRYEDMVAAPPNDMQSSDEIAAFGEQVRGALSAVVGRSIQRRLRSPDRSLLRHHQPARDA